MAVTKHTCYWWCYYHNYYRISIINVVPSVCVVCLLLRCNHLYVKRFVLLISTNDEIYSFCLSQSRVGPQSFVPFDLLVAVSLSMLCFLCFSCSPLSGFSFFVAFFFFFFLVSFQLPSLHNKMSILRSNLRIYVVENEAIIHNFLKNLLFIQESSNSYTNI